MAFPANAFIASTKIAVACVCTRCPSTLDLIKGELHYYIFLKHKLHLSLRHIVDAPMPHLYIQFQQMQIDPQRVQCG